MRNHNFLKLDEKNSYDSSHLLEHINKLEAEKLESEKNFKNLETKYIKTQNELKKCNSDKEIAMKMRDHIFEAFQHSQDKLVTETLSRDNTISELKEELRSLLVENNSLRKSVCKLQMKSNRCDELEYNMKNVQKKFDMQIEKFKENIKSDTMDAIYVVEDINSCIEKFEKDINKTRSDIKIGTHTIEDIIIILEREISLCKFKLNKIKNKFLQQNNIYDIND